MKEIWLIYRGGELTRKRKIRNTIAKTAELLVILAIIKNGPMSANRLRNHWAINPLSVSPALFRLMEKGELKLIDGKYWLVRTASQVLPAYLRPPILMQSESELVNLACVNCYLSILEAEHPTIKPSDAWAGPFAPCTTQSWPRVQQILSFLGLASLMDPSVLHWQYHPAFNNQVEGEEE